jgi:acyl-coenzyme A synthetase/AMP-(fatty) acid ligase
MLLCNKQIPANIKLIQVVRLLCLPQFHAFAGPLYHVAPLREGHTTYIMRRFNLDKFLEYIKVLSITETTMANPIILSILASEKSIVEDVSSLRYVWTAGAPLAASTQNTLSDLLNKDAIVSQVWGLTEIGWITTFHYPEKDRTGSVGRLLPGVEAK